jgi:DNA mismatch repair protein MutL
MSDIRELDPTTVERIAAGEVVERPASVVKELVENSLDAGATRVEVAVEDGGKAGIRVSDDGEGMTESAARKAVEQHTTSKLRDIDDLESGVRTLGFRGEALHAIGAVSRLTIRTRPADAETGTELRVEGGDVVDVSPAGCPAGTTVEVTDLFYNVPARRKYLKQTGTEFAHVNSVVTGYALANADVAVSLAHDGRENFATTGTGDRREAVMAVYGREVATAMVEVDAHDLPDGPLESVTGLVSHPETTRASTDYCNTFVNGRYVTAATVRDAVVDAYGTQLASDRYPFAVVFCEVDPAAVDVNVHPRKLEVRFADAEGVESQVEAAVESALLREGLIRSSAPRGRSAPEQTDITPERIDGAASEGATEQATTTESESVRPETERGADQRAASSRNGGGDGTAAPSGAGRDDAQRETDRTAGTRERTEDGARKFDAAGTQERFGDAEDGATERAFDRLPSMRVLGQFRETYVVAETEDGLLLVDQHAADERVNYERLRERLLGETTTQALADPVTLDLTAREAELFESYTDALARLGFRAARTGERTVEVRTVPALVADAAGPELLREVLASFVAGEREATGTVEAAADELLGDLACYPSVTGNTSLTEGRIVDLLAALDDCENPYACPHGRPTVIEFDDAEIEDRFERDYPGHG